MAEPLVISPGTGTPDINLSFIDFETVLQGLPPETATALGGLITILKTVGIVLIIYFIFLIVNIILSIRRGRMIKMNYQKLNDIENKLDKVLEGKEKKSDSKKESSKKKAK